MTPRTSLGFSTVEFARDVLGIEPLPWQRWLLIHAMELRPDGRFRFRTVLVLVARQNGKTTIVEVKNLWKMFVLRVPLVIGTAQNLDISEESWDKAVEIVESIPDLNAEVAHVDRTNGKKALKLVGGPRWKIAAASRKGGRGLSGDDVNLDELREHQTWNAWAAVTKTTMARRNPQVWAYSNAGDDLSIVLNDLQANGRATVETLNSDSSLGLFEWSAPDDVACTCGRPDGKHPASCRLWDREAWAQANPSLGHTVTEEGLISALETDPEPIFRTECLCQRVPDLVGEWQVIREAEWLTRLAGSNGHPGARKLLDPVAFGVDVTPDRTWAAIAAAGKRVAGGRMVEVVEHQPGTAWIIPWLKERVPKHKPCVVVTSDRAIADAAEEAKLKVVLAGAGNMASAAGMLYDGVAGPVEATRDVCHLGQEELTAAVAGAEKRTLGDGWAWDRRSLSVDICPLVACSLALWGHATPRVHTKRRGAAMASVDTGPGRERQRSNSAPVAETESVEAARMREQIEKDLARS